MALTFTEQEIEEKITRELAYDVAYVLTDLKAAHLFSSEKWCVNRFGNAAQESLPPDGFQFAWDADAKWALWWYEEDQVYRFCFRNANDAVEFKLTWG